MTYVSNRGETVSESESWFWPVDTSRSVLIDPCTLEVTEDTLRQLVIALGYERILAEKKQ